MAAPAAQTMEPTVGYRVESRGTTPITTDSIAEYARNQEAKFPGRTYKSIMTSKECRELSVNTLQPLSPNRVHTIAYEARISSDTGLNLDNIPPEQRVALSLLFTSLRDMQKYFDISSDAKEFNGIPLPQISDKDGQYDLSGRYQRFFALQKVVERRVRVLEAGHPNLKELKTIDVLKNEVLPKNSLQHLVNLQRECDVMDIGPKLSGTSQSKWRIDLTEAGNDPRRIDAIVSWGKITLEQEQMAEKFRLERERQKFATEQRLQAMQEQTKAAMQQVKTASEIEQAAINERLAQITADAKEKIDAKPGISEKDTIILERMAAEENAYLQKRADLDAQSDEIEMERIAFAATKPDVPVQ